MPSERAFPLWTAAVVLGVLAIILTELALRGIIGFDTARIAGFAIFFVNVAVALFGIRRRSRVVWVVYLLLSVALMVLIGANTPVSAVWIVVKFLT